MSAHLSRRSLLGLVGAGAGAYLLSGCSDDASDDPDAPQTINWWHIQNTEPMLPVWAAVAQEYQAAHNNVKIEIQPLENEAFKAKLTTATQAGSPPDLFQSWGGGVLKQQVDAGLVKDLTETVAPWKDGLLPLSLEPYTVDGKIYGVPFDIGMVGFWYNKDLFAKAQITAPPATWAELLDVVRKLKAAGVTPVALAGKDKWPAHFYWAYLSMRIGGLGALQQAAKDKNFETPDFVAAGERFKELIDLQPFQKGFLGAEYGSPDGQAATMGNGGAALELMGQWAPSVQASSSTSKKGLGDKLGFFPFPAVDGGKGTATEVFGGGNGFAVGKDAPPATMDFLKTLLSADVQRRSTKTGAVLPTVKEATDAITDPNNKVVAQTLAAATGFQLYLDQAYPPAVGQQVNDSVAALVAGSKSPAQILKDITQVAKTQ
ncbi:extracellular solute-binding protein [Micromonospora rifamycinica]|uniref:Raffinose/stachyose/melibiose transport system substrate-binding protein n=1 Tax=Micromonospora rifamycinica TaxID=291594 RepID=A0A120F8Y6_9ACTN|nr:extracellular solute-binding protein [Micromonospora rifamycinica]KWV32556.1 ABC transporter substrate-binding protein [Micromonospora rifamycinica]SCG38505.1 raffinose/stachyose/melibiose transport system substrate-binding protein [Micromonospora rifamycinica]